MVQNSSLEMADNSRQEKIASARKKLKKFQQRKSPLMKIATANKTPQNPLEISKEKPPVENGTKVSPDIPLQNFTDVSYSSPSVDKIKQMLNGFAKQDLINGEDPIISEIDALERRNSDLERSLSSHKRNNEHLGNHVNEQRKQILQLQEQIKKERTELANRQLLEQRSLKEQLEVHIQTIGILVSEKFDLQTTLSQLQRKYQTKEGECTDLTSRVQKLRQQTAGNERDVATQKSKLEKFTEENNQLRKDRDRVQTTNYTLTREKEDLLQQNSEIRQKLQVKVDEYLLLEKTSADLAKKLNQTELIVQQLSNDPSASAAHEITKTLQEEKTALQNKLEKQTATLQRLAVDKGEMIERHNQEIEQLEFKLQKLVEANEMLESQQEQLNEVQKEYEETILELKKQIDEQNDQEATNQSEATRLAAQEIQKLVEEKETLARFLQEQSNLNDTLNKDLLESEAKVSKLEQMVNNLSKESQDKKELLESIQSDKETISKALQQNKDLKIQLSELESHFIQMSNDNMELSTSLESEKHANREIGEKLSDTTMELVDVKGFLSKKEIDIAQLNKSLNEQIDANTKYQHYEAQGRLTDILHQELQSAQDTVNQLSSQNAELKQLLIAEQNKLQNENTESFSDIVDHKETKEQGVQQMPDLVLKTGDLRVEAEQGYLQNGRLTDEEDSWPSDSSEDEIDDDEYVEQPETKVVQTHSQTTSSPPAASSKYSNREDVVHAMSASIRQLEMERNGLRYQLAEVTEKSRMEVSLLQEHIEMQVHQEVQQRQRELLEQVHQQLREQQHQIQALQELVQKQKEQIENQDAVLDEIDVENCSLSYEQLKPAFGKLQSRFLRIMSEKAELLDKIQELEHISQQLSAETETIGEYISLYQTQKAAMKQYYYEREKLITHLSNERANMQAKIGQLQSLIVQQLQGQKHRHHEQPSKESIIDNHDSQTLPQDINSEMIKNSNNDDTASEASVVSIGLEQVDQEELEELAGQDGTTQQIFQIFDQLNVSAEGLQAGWFSPAARKHQFKPCRRCQTSSWDV